MILANVYVLLPCTPQNDKRYLVLECIADERERMLKNYIEDLHKKGPPPPPTATHPSERLRKSALGPLVT